MAVKRFDPSKCPQLPDFSDMSAEQLTKIQRGPLRCVNCGEVLELTCKGLGATVDNVMVLLRRADVDELLRAEQDDDFIDVDRVEAQADELLDGERRRILLEGSYGTAERVAPIERTPAPPAPSRVRLDHLAKCSLNNGGKNCSCSKHQERAAADPSPERDHTAERHQRKERTTHIPECRLNRGGKRCSCARHEEPVPA